LYVKLQDTNVYFSQLKGLQKKNDKKKAAKEGSPSSGGKKVCEMKPPPEFIASRLVMWDRLKAEQDAEMAAKVPVDITVTLPDGKTVPGQSWRTTPYDIASGISKGLADSCVVAKVNGEVWDLDRVLEGDVKLELIKFDDDEGQAVFWHSSAHILGEAMERVYGGHLCYGPPIEQGFYYDMHSADVSVKDEDYKVLDDLVKNIVKEKQPFERLTMKKSDLMEMFKYNEFKLRILREKVTTETTTVYRCGPLIDLCRGPHVRHTGKIKSMACTKSSATYWEGNSEAESLQRIYGISFPDNKLMKEWKLFQEEAAKRDHRKIGVQQDLFFFHELSPGSCFFQPKELTFTIKSSPSRRRSLAESVQPQHLH
jgi:threonyl-tRNA synthetase